MKPIILFVDDDANILESYQRTLRRMRAEWEMLFAPSVNAALDMLANGRPHVIVSDIDMPKKDGLEFLADVQSDEQMRAIPCIIVTGKHESGLTLMAHHPGAA